MSYIIHICSGITCGRWKALWKWKALCTEITEVNLSAFVYKLFHEDFSSVYGMQLCARPSLREYWRNLYMKQMNELLWKTATYNQPPSAHFLLPEVSITLFRSLGSVWSLHPGFDNQHKLVFTLALIRHLDVSDTHWLQSLVKGSIEAI